MLPERTFAIGGAICIALACLLIGAATALWFPAELLGFVPAGLVSFVLGALFLLVARDARRSRRELLDLGNGEGGGKAPPR